MSDKKYTICMLVLVCSVICNGWLLTEVSSLKNAADKIQKEITYYENVYKREVEKREQLYTDLSGELEKYEDMEDEYGFYHRNACIVTEYGNRYHTYDCHHWKDSDTFWIYNTEYAQYKGYTPCYTCNPPQ